MIQENKPSINILRESFELYNELHERAGGLAVNPQWLPLRPPSLGAGGGKSKEKIYGERFAFQRVLAVSLPGRAARGTTEESPVGTAGAFECGAYAAAGVRGSDASNETEQNQTKHLK